jgi:hypothetical protein
VTTGEGINNSKYKSSSESTEKNKFLANALRRRQENEKDHKAKEKEKEKEKDMIIEEKEKGGEHEVSEDPEKQEKEKKEEEEGEEEERSDLGLRKQKRKRERKLEMAASFLTAAAEHRKEKQKEEKGKGLKRNRKNEDSGSEDEDDGERNEGDKGDRVLPDYINLSEDENPAPSNSKLKAQNDDEEESDLNEHERNSQGEFTNDELCSDDVDGYEDDLDEDRYAVGRSSSVGPSGAAAAERQEGLPIDALDLDDFLDVAKIRAMLPPQARDEPPLTEEQRIVQVLLTRLLSPAATFRPTRFPLDLPTERGLHRFATALTRVWPLGLDPGPPPPRLSAAQQRLWRFVVVQMRRIRDGLRIAIHALTQTFTDTEQSRRATRDALSREIRLLLGTQYDLNGELQFLVDPNAARALRDSQKENGPVYEKEDLEELKSASEKNRTLKEVHKQAVSAAADRFFGFGYPRRFQRRRGSGFSPAGTRGRRFQSGQARKGRRNFRGRGNRIDDSNSNNRANSNSYNNDNDNDNGNSNSNRNNGFSKRGGGSFRGRGGGRGRVK